MDKTETKRFRESYMRNSRAHLLSRLTLEIHLFNEFNGDRRWDHPAMQLPCNAIYLVTGGDGWIGDGEKETPLRSGQAYLLPLHTPMSVRCRSAVHKFWGFFSFCLLPGVDLFDGIRGYRELGPFDLGGTDERFREAVCGQTAADYLIIQSVILRALSRLGNELEERMATTTGLGDRYAPLFEAISRTANARLRLTELADIMKMTPEGLSRAFRRDMGLTLKTYLQNHLNDRACAMLAGGTLKVKEIAHRLGYEDEYYFIRCFTRQNSASPTAYRGQFQDA